MVSWTVLIAGYVQHGCAQEALYKFENMQQEGFSPNAVTFACILKACGATGAIDKGKSMHDEIVQRNLLKHDPVLGNALVDMYGKCGSLVMAQKVFEELLVRDVVAWTSLISGYVQYGLSEMAIKCFDQMHYEGLSPNAVTYACILQACGGTGSLEKGKEIHVEMIKDGLLGGIGLLDNALVDMYAKCGALVKA